MASRNRFEELLKSIVVDDVSLYGFPPPAISAPVTEELPHVRLEKYFSSHNENLRNERCQQLIACLTALRKPENSDVVLVCDDREFYCHKIILEASSPYFTTMFSAGLAETQSGRVQFKEMDAEILEIILDFVYSGDISKMKSEEQIKKLLVSAHLMQLEKLFNHCCGALEIAFSDENFSELWQIGLNYERENLTSKAMEYVQAHLNELSEKNEILLLSFDQIHGLLLFFKEKVRSLNDILKVLLKWLIYDTERREKKARELFARIDIKMVSKDCAKSLLEDVTIMNSSTEIANRMNELGVKILLYGN